MRGIVLCGPLGVGKTTALRRLHEHAGATVPVTMTTRALSASDFGLETITESAFAVGVREGWLHMPLVAAGVMYAWPSVEFRLMQEAPRVALSVRPYTGLALAALVAGLLPVWLDLSEERRQARLADRNEQRDQHPHLATARRNFDLEDRAYRDFFDVKIEADGNLVSRLEELYVD